MGGDTNIFPGFICSEGLEAATLWEQGAHPAPRSWFLNPIFLQKKSGLPRKMADWGVVAGSSRGLECASLVAGSRPGREV